jgi:2-amino-4-hydroxy-6-hydroxymethyldihydropteridine diphosphokinase
LVIAYLGLGSNLGCREGNIAQALKLLRQRMVIERISSIYETEPVGYREQPWFLNAVCRVSTNLAPLDLLHVVRGIEGKLGRVRSFPNGPRVIDIDILFYGDVVMETEDLTIPHSRIVERPFVLFPLAEIAPKLFHPVAKKPIEELLQEVLSLHQVRRWGDVSNIGAAAF